MSDLTARKALIDSLAVGDLIRLNGKLRVIRDIGRRSKRSPLKPEQVRSITMSILRCSWTRRPTTTRVRTDLYHVELEIVKRGYGTEHGPIEYFLQQDIENGTRILDCCDVIGVIS